MMELADDKLTKYQLEVQSEQQTSKYLLIMS